jgi:hypothetical protein
MMFRGQVFVLFTPRWLGQLLDRDTRSMPDVELHVRP